jgi:hypothetical protein
MLPGFFPQDFILSLKPDEWDLMLDSMIAEAKRANVEVKPGHRMHFKKRLRDLQVSFDADGGAGDVTPRTPRASSGAQLQQQSSRGGNSMDDPAPSANRNGIDGDDDNGDLDEYGPASRSAQRRPTRLQVDGDDDSSSTRINVRRDGRDGRRGGGVDEDENDPADSGKREVGSDDRTPSASIAICFEGLRCMQVHWFVCFGTALCSLVTAICLLVLLNNISTVSTAAPTTQNATAGGWTFARAVMVIAFIIASFACCGCLLTYGRTQTQGDVLSQFCPDPARIGCPSLPSCPALPECDMCRPQPMDNTSGCDVACPALDGCSAPECDCRSFFPKCSCPAMPYITLPSCDDISTCVRKTINVFACRCKCNVQIE